jgi:tetratricopeptide (TPR) repeat protein
MEKKLRGGRAARPNKPEPREGKSRKRRRRAERQEATGVPSVSRKIDLRQVQTALWLLGATLIAYLPALNGRLLWDDDAHVTKPALQSFEGLWRIWFQLGATQQYYPLLHSAFWIEHRLWGDAVTGYHLVNVVLHAAAACLVVMIVRRLSLPGAWLAGFVFALHPVCVEAVAWISEQKSTLSAVFYLGSALAYLHFDETRRRSRYLLALGLFVLALLTKTVTATLPAALLVVLWWRRGRLEWKRDVLPLLGWFPLGAAAGLFTAWVEKRFVGAEGADYTLTVAQRFLLAGRAICFYAAKLAWPVNLTFTYPRWTINPGQWWQYLFPAGVVVAVAVLCLLARRNRGPLAGFLIFSGTLFPVLGFLNVYPFRYSWVADHFQYLACLGVIVPAACALAGAAVRIPLIKTHGAAFAAMLLVVPGVLTWRQCGMYGDAETLYRETLQRNPASYMAHVNLGNLLLERPGRLPDAIAEYEAALRIRPDNAEAHNSLGAALMRTPGRVADAIAEFETALRSKPDYAEAHNSLGSALMQTPGRSADGIAEFETALRLRPDYVEAHVNLGNALLDIPGRRQDAIAEFETALLIQPDFEPARQALRRLQSPRQ